MWKLSAIVMAIIAFFSVAQANWIPNAVKNNADVLTVTGDSTDGHSDNTLMGRTKLIAEHIHHVSYCYPELANPIELTSDAGVWAAFPAPTEIIPANTVTSDFDVHYVTVSTISTNGEYVLRLYQGGAGVETEIGCTAFTKTVGAPGEGKFNIGTPLMAANTRISAAISNSAAGASTVDIKVSYHTY